VPNADLIFKGDAIHQLDDKARFKLPVKMQEVFESKDIGPRCVLMKLPEGCLALYPASAWDKEYGHLMSGNKPRGLSTPEYRKLTRQIGARSNDVKVGVQGRVPIPDDFRGHIGVNAGDNVWIIGSGSRIEIWPEGHSRTDMEGGNEEFDGLLTRAADEDLDEE
jgi:division/cell wall cluster transcriptional repressor MraZ